MRAALAGRAGWSVEDAGSGDVIRGAVPIASRTRPGRTSAARWSSTPSSPSRSRATSASSARRSRSTARSSRSAGNIRTAYLLELVLGFLVILMLATWVGFRITKGVTGPIRALARASAEVARGNLEVAGRAAHGRRGRLPGALLQPHDARPARCARPPRALERRARPTAPLDGGGARHDRRRGALARRRGADHHREPHRAAPAGDRGGCQPDRRPAGRLRAARRSCAT